MISFQKRFLFVHIPKTAGNSIQSVLRGYSEDELVALRGEQDGIERFGLRNPKHKIKKHSPLAEYRTPSGRRSLPTAINLQVYEIRGTGWSRITLRRHKSREHGTKKIPNYLWMNERDNDPFENVNFIMRFENLADDFRTVCAALDISPTILPWYNRSNREHYSKYYDDELRELVRTRFVRLRRVPRWRSALA
jgi:hypothetical protein